MNNIENIEELVNKYKRYIMPVGKYQYWYIVDAMREDREYLKWYFNSLKMSRNKTDKEKELINAISFISKNPSKFPIIKQRRILGIQQEDMTYIWYITEPTGEEYETTLNPFNSNTN